ncbi:hypothetical protein SAY86_022632 [Trapa natans]|uniref:HTH myb-type domain-containing protein n=1 Tax=Trapa natans TaxID=22666 RepID=A0AAN7R762_TRANT|nr:hypothetical protein SAY86_022632 [Trapa natans]
MWWNNWKMEVGYAQKMQSYMEALEVERRKILVFGRELPLCLEIVTHAIGACKQQLTATGASGCNNNSNWQWECSEQTSTEVTEIPVLEEFIPMKRRSRSPCDDDEDNDEEEHLSNYRVKIDKDSNNNESMEKSSSGLESRRESDWLKSAQLWNRSPDPPPKEVHRQPLSPRKVLVLEVKRGGGAFQPFRKEQNCPAKNHHFSESLQSVAVAPTAGTSSETEMIGSGRMENREEKHAQVQTRRKQRRCWSPELHRRFLQALQQLGGSHVATPKQIREVMKVDSLTNDEVKSHLQKFRLHSKRPSPLNMIDNSSSRSWWSVGGIWVPPSDYAAASHAAKTALGGRIHVREGAVPPPAVAAAEVNSIGILQSEGRGSHSSQSNSSTSSSSSSSHTTSASPSC